MPIYLDYNATAPAYPEVAAKMQEWLALPANPSSAHAYGRYAKKQLETARQSIAASISAWPNEVIFTGSATEANHTALRSFPDRRLMVSAIEHSSVLSALSHRAGNLIPVRPDGILDLAALDALLAADDGPALVSVMLANNETGVIQPIGEISAICKKYGALLHSDAVQALGKLPVDFGTLGVDMLTLSGHKCGGPLGAAALIVRRDLAITSLLVGGGQESRRRASTENIAAIAGFSVAVEKTAKKSHLTDLRRWLNGMEGQMAHEGAIIFGQSSPRLPNTSCVAMPGVSNEVQLMDFDLKGFAVSAGSACSSGRIEPSHVLQAMGVSKELAACAIRISGGWNTSEQDIQSFTGAWKQLRHRLKR